MSSWLTFVIGVILGLLVGWLIDLLYRRRAQTPSGLESVESQAALPAWAAREAEVAAEAVAPAPVAEAAVEGAGAESAGIAAAALAEEPAALEPPEAVEALAPTVAPDEAPERAAVPIDGSDRLTIIEGIGPAYDARLRAAGIHTFRQLAETSPERLRQIVQPQSWQRANFAEWIEQARLAAEGKDEELKALQARLFSRNKG
ncbi:MAG: helix-hairpin-helix domain-containing protein [Nitrososphaerales archaeon]